MVSSLLLLPRTLLRRLQPRLPRRRPKRNSLRRWTKSKGRLTPRRLRSLTWKPSACCWHSLHLPIIDLHKDQVRLAGADRALPTRSLPGEVVVAQAVLPVWRISVVRTSSRSRTTTMTLRHQVHPEAVAQAKLPRTHSARSVAALQQLARPAVAPSAVEASLRRGHAGRRPRGSGTRLCPLAAMREAAAVGPVAVMPQGLICGLTTTSTTIRSMSPRAKASAAPVSPGASASRRANMATESCGLASRGTQKPVVKLTTSSGLPRQIVKL